MYMYAGKRKRAVLIMACKQEIFKQLTKRMS